MAKQKRRYITGFDGLRTIGVLGVILYHIRSDIFQGGYLGVPIFMVVSGYLITDGLNMEFDRTGGFDFKGFWQRRFRRLYPGLLLMLLVTSACITLFFRSLLGQLNQIVLSNLTYVYNWWQIMNGQSYFAQFAQGTSPFTHLWTLSIEGQFYLVWPLIVLFLRRHAGKKFGRAAFTTAMGLSIVSALIMAVLYQPKIGVPYDPSRLYYGTDTRAFSILLGAALAFIWPSQRLVKSSSVRNKLILNLVGTIAIVGMLAMVGFTSDQSPWLYRGGMFVFSILVTILVAVVAHPDAVFNRLLTNPVFSWVGSRSYGLYLYQLPVMVFVEARATNFASHPVLYPVLEVVLIVALTELSYRFVEKPLAHADFSDVGVVKFFKSLKQNHGRAIVTGVLAIVAVVGMAGIAEAPSVKAVKTTSPLEKQLQDNKKSQAEKKRRLKQLKENIAAAKKSSQSSAKSSSSATSSSSSQASSSSAQPKPNSKYGLTADETSRAQSMGITAIGDSVMKDGETDLQEIFPKAYIDAAVSRQAVTGVQLLEYYAKQGALADTILIGLGTNGPVTSSAIDDAMRTATTKRQVYWINVRVPTRPWQSTTNNALIAGAKKYKNLHIIDWYHFCNAHEEWFYNDRVHPKPSGNIFYAGFIAKQILR